MTWENHGRHGWHIDHIIPCAAFDLTDPEQQKKCFHYTNYQPLYTLENLKKGDRIIQFPQTQSGANVPADEHNQTQPAAIARAVTQAQ